MKEYELAIIGAGPAGMSAALNAKNDGLEAILIESEEGGWFPRVSVDSHYYVDNYLGFGKVTGTEIIREFQEHLTMKDITVFNGFVENIRKEGNRFFIDTSSDVDFLVNGIILANGTKQKELNVPGIEKFIGNSIFYYCVPDGPQFNGKNVLVVGGRNTGTVTALYLKQLGCTPQVIEKNNQVTAKDKYASRILNAKIPYLTGTEVVGLVGDKNLSGVRIRDSIGKLGELAVEGIFICIGLKPNNYLAKSMGVNLDENGYVLVDKNMATNVEGVYAAGDITGGLKQIVVAAAQGSIAAYNLNKYLNATWKKE